MKKKSMSAALLAVLVYMGGCASPTPKKSPSFSFKFEESGVAATVSYQTTGKRCAAVVFFRNNSNNDYRSVSIRISAYSAENNLIGTSSFYLRNGLIAGGTAQIGPSGSTELSTADPSRVYTRCPDAFTARATLRAI